jgi:hypothetical protein
MRGLFADLILILHAAIVLFIILGLVLTSIGAILRWRWIRNAWFRGIHLAAIAIVAGQAWAGRICPLTVWEDALRVGSGGAGYEGSFIQHWLHEVIYYDLDPMIFTLAYSGFALIVFGTWILAPPDLVRTRR